MQRANSQASYILVAGISKDDNGKRAQSLNGALPANNSNILGAGMWISRKVIDDQNYQVSD